MPANNSKGIGYKSTGAPGQTGTTPGQSGNTPGQGGTPPPGPGGGTPGQPGQNTAPTDIDVSNLTLDENAAGAVIGTVTAVDPDAGDTHTFAVNDPRFEIVNGTLKLKDGISLDYETGSTVPLTITATDSQGGSFTKTLEIVVTDVNEQPAVSGPVLGSATEDGAASTLDALANASDVDGDSLSVVGVPAALPDGVSYDAQTRTFTLDPTHAAYQALAANETVAVSVDYQVSDGVLTTAASVTWTVTGTNDGPVVSGTVSGGATEDGAASTLDALADATDPDGDSLSVVGVPAALPAGVSYDAQTRSFTLDPTHAAYQALAAGEPVTVSVDYQVSDGVLTTAASVTWTVTGTNDGPVVSGTVSGGATEDGAASTLDALANASDVDGDSLSVVGVPASLPAGVSYDAQTRSFTLDPSHAAYQALAANETVAVSVDYGVFDGIDTTAASVAWTVTGTNDGPVVSASVSSEATEDGATSTLDALANATDPDGDSLSVVGVPAALPDGVSYDAQTRTFTLDPTHAAYQALAAGEPVTVSVDYQVSDGVVTTAASVAWTVTGTNDGPIVSAAVSGEATEDGAASTLDALANATDPDGDNLSVVGVPAALPAGVSYDAQARSFTLDPTHAAYQALAAGEPVTVSVDYGVFDGTITTPASVSWIVTGSNDGPVVSAAVSGEATEDGAASTLDALANATDPDGDSLSVVGVPAGLPAGVSYDAQARSFTLDPTHAAYQALATGETTTVSVDYGVFDGTDTTAASVAWTVTGSNDGPVIEETGGELEFGPTFLANQATSNDQMSPRSTELENGNVVVVWQNGVHSGHTSSVRLFSPDGTPLGNEFTVGGAGALQPNVEALDGGGFVVAWAYGSWPGDIRLQRFDANGSALGGEQVVDTSIVGGPQMLALPGGGFMIFYHTDGGGSGNVAGRVYDAAGVGGPEFYVTNAAGSQGDPHSVLLSNGNVLISWGDASEQIYFSTLSQTGTMLSGPTLLASGTGHHSGARIAALDGGGAVITWEDLSGGEITARIVGNDGSTISQFQVNTTTAGTQGEDHVIALADGGFLVSWVSNVLPDGTPDGDYAVIARQFDANGNPVTDEFVLASNEGVAGFAPAPRLLALQDGSVFAVFTGGYTGDADANSAIVGRVVQLAGGAQAGAVTEAADGSAGETGNVVHQATGSFAFADIDLTDGHSVSVAEDGAGYRGTLTASVVDPSTGDGSGSIAWTFAVQDSALDDLAAGQMLTQTYTVSVSDGNGGVAEQTVTITITGADDAVAPVITSGVQAGAITELADGAPGENTAPHNAAGTITYSDANPGDTHTASFVPQGPGYLGTFSLGAVNQAADSFNWSFAVSDAALDSLAADQVVTQSYDVTVNDGHGGTATDTVTVTLNGSNDGPEIAGGGGGELELGPTFLANQATSNDQVSPRSTVLENGNVVVVWQNGIHSGHTSSVRLFSPDGTPIGNEFTVGGAGAIQPNVEALDGGGFVVAWAYGSWPGDIRLQRFDANGSALAGEQVVDTSIVGGPQMLALPGGGFMIFYHTDGGGSGNVGARIYNAAGVGAPEFYITNAPGSQGDAHAALLSNGNVMVTWGDASEQTYFSILSQTGTLLSGPTLIASATGQHGGAQVVALEGGGAVFTWEDYSGGEIIARLINNDGSTISQFQVNTTTAGTQGEEHVIALADGGFMVSWFSNVLPGGAPDSDYAVLARQFDANGNPVTDEFVLASNEGSGGAVPSTRLAELQDGSVFAVYSGGYTGDADPNLAIVGRIIQLGGGDQSGAVTEAADGSAGETGNATHEATGTFAFSDVDLIDTHSVNVAADGPGYRGLLTASVGDAATGDGAGTIDWIFSVEDSAIDDLVAGQVLTQAYTVSVSDGHGGSASQAVTVTITGAHDAPEVVI